MPSENITFYCNNAILKTLSMFSNPTLNISYSEPKYEGDESSVAASPFLPVKVFPHTHPHRWQTWHNSNQGREQKPPKLPCRALLYIRVTILSRAQRRPYSMIDERRHPLKDAQFWLNITNSQHYCTQLFLFSFFMKNVWRKNITCKHYWVIGRDVWQSWSEAGPTIHRQGRLLPFGSKFPLGGSLTQKEDEKEGTRGEGGK